MPYHDPLAITQATDTSGSKQSPFTPFVGINESHEKHAYTATNSQLRQSAPRTRGDGPSSPPPGPPRRCCSPHPRGWSRGRSGRRSPRSLLPAPAGMVPNDSPTMKMVASAPRTRGDGPGRSATCCCLLDCSPHPRGWSFGVLVPGHLPELLPAPAGMVLPDTLRTGQSVPAPRTRGDGPAAPISGASSTTCSPHPRGWSRAAHGRGHPAELLPAPAGMVPAWVHVP